MKAIIALLALTLVSCGGVTGNIKANCQPVPVADAGPDQIAVKGLSLSNKAQLGTPAVEGSEYRWLPSDGLDNPRAAQPIATITGSMLYQLVVTNKCGLAQDSVAVDLYAE